MTYLCCQRALDDMRIQRPPTPELWRSVWGPDMAMPHSGELCTLTSSKRMTAWTIIENGVVAVLLGGLGPMMSSRFLGRDAYRHR